MAPDRQRAVPAHELRQAHSTARCGIASIHRVGRETGGLRPDERADARVVRQERTLDLLIRAYLQKPGHGLDRGNTGAGVPGRVRFADRRGAHLDASSDLDLSTRL